MKPKLLKLTAILLITAGIFTACSCIEIEIHDEPCPIKEILVGGKWEAVEWFSPHSTFRETVQARVHFEFFLDGRMRKFDRIKNEYIYGTYAVETRKGAPFPWAPNEMIEYWHLSEHLEGRKVFSYVGIFKGENEKIVFDYNWGLHFLHTVKRKQ